jgi:hypothetical protein
MPAASIASLIFCPVFSRPPKSPTTASKRAIVGSETPGDGQEDAAEFVVAGGNTPPVFDVAEEVFDFVPLAIKVLGPIGFLAGGVAARDDRQGAFGWGHSKNPYLIVLIKLLKSRDLANFAIILGEKLMSTNPLGPPPPPPLAA